MYIGSKIRDERKRKLLKQKELASLVGITPGALSLIEEGKRTPSKEVLKKIAKAFGIPLSFFLQPDEQYLQTYSLIPKDIEMIFKKIQVLEQQDKELITKHLIEFNEPEDYARELRKAIGVEDQLIDPFQVAQDLGIKVKEDNFKGFDGALIKSGRKILILLNEGMARNRKAFTVAHELGHWYIVEHKNKDYTCSAIGRYNSNEPTEQEADRFSAEFLMPRKVFQEIMKDKTFSLASITDIADYFNVSMQAAAIKYTQLAKASCAVILTESGIIKWFSKSYSFKYFINIKIPPSEKTLAQQFYIKSPKKNILEGRVSINAWVQIDKPERRSFHEESQYFSQYDSVLTLLLV